MKTKANVWAAAALAAVLVVSTGLLQAAPMVYHVRSGGIGDGSSWAQAGGDLQAGIEEVASSGGGFVWVAEGVYLPNSHPNGGSVAREMHFSLRTGVEVYGGFPATGDPRLRDRDPAAHLTVCSGDIGTSDDPRDNVFHVFYHPSSVGLDPTARLDGFTIRDGKADGTGTDQSSGAGMFNDSNRPLLVRCVFSDNHADADGGALANVRSDPHLVNCVFTGNSANLGGAMVNLLSTASIVNSVFFNNRADFGGAIYNGKGAEPLFSSCTIFGNVAYTGGGGGGVYNDSSQPRIENTILWANENGQVVDQNSSASVLSFCIIEDGWSGGGNDNLDTDPRFVDPESHPGPDGIWATGDDGLRLKPDSPGLNSGDHTLLPADTADLDADGDTVEQVSLDLRSGVRVAFKALDRGAYEVQLCIATFDPGSHGTRVGGGQLVQEIPEGGTAEAPTLAIDFGWLFTSWDQPYDQIYNDLTVTALYTPAFGPGGVCHIREGGTGNGTSWDEAAGDLQLAIDAVHATGGGSIWVSHGTYKPNRYPNGGSDPRAVHFSLRNGVKVLGGFPPTGSPGLADRNLSGYPTVLSGEIGTGGPLTDAWHVFYHPPSAALDASAWLDGVTITRGFASNGLVSPHTYGGGMFNSACSPTLVRCIFKSNRSSEQGGGLYLGDSTSEVVNCTFDGNISPQGGAVYLHQAGARFANCMFSGNNANGVAGLGGAVHSYGSAVSLFSNCTFFANTAGDSGGAIYTNTGPLAVANSILWDNTPNQSDGSPGVTYDYCLLQTPIVTGSGNFVADPLFLNPAAPAGPDGVWFTSDDGLRLPIHSPAFNAGSTDALLPDTTDLDGDGDTTEPLPLDVLGMPRALDGIPEPGPYETLAGVMSLVYWRSLHFSAPDRADPTKEATVWGDYADSDFDGITNAGEYLMLLDPNVFDNPMASAGLVDYLGTPWFSFEYNKAKNRPGVSEEVKTSTTLEPGSWVATGFLREIIDQSSEHTAYQVLIPLGSARRFARLEFTVTP